MFLEEESAENILGWYLFMERLFIYQGNRSVVLMAILEKKEKLNIVTGPSVAGQLLL